MKTINLFLKVNLTSQSPDGQIISVGIVSDDIPRLSKSDQIHKSMLFGDDTVLSDTRSFYAEFSDFDINRCDDWTKENVVGKLEMKGYKDFIPEGGGKEEYGIMDFADNSIKHFGNTDKIKEFLKEWLSQFSDYQIQFIIDKGSWEWVKFCELIGEWKKEKYCARKGVGLCQVKLGKIENCPSKMFFKGWDEKEEFECQAMFYMRFGSPILPENISPVPLDLNDLIAFKRRISAKEAFEIDRIILWFGWNSGHSNEEQYEKASNEINQGRFNALWEAKVIKEVFNKLK